MDRKILAAAAAALALTAVSARANFELTFNESLTYSLADLTPDDGQAAGVTFYGGPLPTGNAFPTAFDVYRAGLGGFAEEYFTRFTLTPHTQLTFDGFIDASASVDAPKGGARYGDAIEAWAGVIWNAGRGQGAGVETLAGGFYGHTLSDHDYAPIHFVLTNDTDRADYGQLVVHFGDAFYATSDAPEPPVAVMLGLGLLSLAALRRRSANS